MFVVDGYSISLSRGDTGAVRIKADATLNEEAFTFGSDDRALFSLRNANGELVMEKVSEMQDNAFVVYFQNGDTDGLASGSYTWDVRYIIHPYYDDSGRIVNGNQVITPKEPQSLTLLVVVGDV